MLKLAAKLSRGGGGGGGRIWPTACFSATGCGGKSGALLCVFPAPLFGGETRGSSAKPACWRGLEGGWGAGGDRSRSGTHGGVKPVAVGAGTGRAAERVLTALCP